MTVTSSRVDLLSSVGCPVSAALTASQTSGASGVASCVMCPHASYPHVQRSSTPSSRAAAIADSSSGISSAVSPKLGNHNCDATSCRSHVSRSSRAKRRTNGPAASFQCFQYGSVAKVVRPGSDATMFQSEIPCDPSVDGSRQIVLRPPCAATCATTSRRKSTIEASRNACTSGVRSLGIGPPNRSSQCGQRHVQRAGSSIPTWAGTIHAGSSQKTESTPQSSTQSAHSQQKAR